jgi:hypothetical protein
MAIQLPVWTSDLRIAIEWEVLLPAMHPKPKVTKIPQSLKGDCMLLAYTDTPPSILQQDQTIWAFVHLAAENIGILPSTERD